MSFLFSCTGFGEEHTSNYVFPVDKDDFFYDCFFKWFSGKFYEENTGTCCVDQTLLSQERGGEDPLAAAGLLPEAEDPCGLNFVTQLSYVVCPFLIWGHISLLFLYR